MRPGRLGIVSALVLAVVACSDSSSTSATRSTSSTSPPTLAAAACSAEVKEPIDPGTGRHVLPGGTEPTFITDPPTSGPHTPGVVASGVLDTPLSRPAQVGSLEGGGVLLQYRELTTDELTTLTSLAGDKVAVLPNADLPDRIVATAWLTKQTCTRIDVAALTAFITNHKDHGPE